MDYINAFWVGGAICALVQILMEKTKMLPGRIMVNIPQFTFFTFIYIILLNKPYFLKFLIISYF